MQAAPIKEINVPIELYARLRALIGRMPYDQIAGIAQEMDAIYAIAECAARAPVPKKEANNEPS